MKPSPYGQEDFDGVGRRQREDTATDFHNRRNHIKALLLPWAIAYKITYI